MDISSLKSAIEAALSAIALFKSFKGTLPPGPKRDEIEKTLSQAEQDFRLAEVQIAQSLGYELCQCTWPPQIMLAIEHDSDGFPTFQCPECKRKESPGSIE